MSSSLGTAKDEAGGWGATCRGAQGLAAPGPSRVADAWTAGLLCTGPPDWPGLRVAELSGEAGLLQHWRLEAGKEKWTVVP